MAPHVFIICFNNSIRFICWTSGSPEASRSPLTVLRTSRIPAVDASCFSAILPPTLAQTDLLVSSQNYLGQSCHCDNATVHNPVMQESDNADNASARTLPNQQVHDMKYTVTERFSCIRYSINAHRPHFMWHVLTLPHT